MKDYNWEAYKKQIKCLCTYNDFEFCSNEFNTYCKLEDIVRYQTVVGTP